VNFSDPELIAQYLKGDILSLETLIQRYLGQIYSFTRRFVGNPEEAEDITQEVFVRIWRNLKKFDQQKSFKTWIFSIAKNACIDFLKKKKTLSFSEFENESGENIIAETLADPAPLPQELLEQKGLADLLAGALEKLSPKYRMVLFLRYNDHFSFQEIADSLNESLDTIRSRHYRALFLLRDLLKEKNF